MQCDAEEEGKKHGRRMHNKQARDYMVESCDGVVVAGELSQTDLQSDKCGVCSIAAQLSEKRSRSRFRHLFNLISRKIVI